MKFIRGIPIKEAIDIGNKEAQIAGKIGFEAKRMGLIKCPDEEVGGLFPEDPSFQDLAQWVLPNDRESGILFCRYTEFEKKEERERGSAEYHLMFINQKGNSQWDEHQTTIEEGMELLNKSSSWEDLSNKIGV